MRTTCYVHCTCMYNRLPIVTTSVTPLAIGMHVPVDTPIVTRDPNDSYPGVGKSASSTCLDCHTTSLEVLGNMEPSIVVELLTKTTGEESGSLMGCAPKCKPSVRRASCQPHCTQVSGPHSHPTPFIAMLYY